MRQRIGLAQFPDCDATRLVVRDSGGAELVVSLVGILRQLFDDLRFAGGTEPQRSEPRPQGLGPFIPGLRAW